MKLASSQSFFDRGGGELRRRFKGLFSLLRGLKGSVLTALALGLPVIAHGQESQFFFDASGNLQAQTSELVAPPKIVGQPQNQIVQPGKTASFSVLAADTRNLAYQWFFDGQPIAGATGDTLLLFNVGASNEGQYTVTLDNGSDPVTSAPASLFIDSDADGLPDSWEQTYFHDLSQTAADDSDGDGVSNGQEFLDGTNPTNAASVRYRITVFNDGGTVEVDPIEVSYTNGQVVTLTAVGSAAFPFHVWTGDVLTHSNSISLLMNGNKTVFAHFTPLLFVWTNMANGDWNTASNWRPNLVPGSNDNVAILNPVIVTLSSNADVGDFTFGEGSPTLELTGTGILVCHGKCSWAAGIMAGSGRTVIDSGATLEINNTGPVLLNTRILENRGTVRWTGSQPWNFSNGGAITNLPGAWFEVQSAASCNWVYPYGAVARIDNAGVFCKSSSAGALAIGGSVIFNNYGTVDLQTGTLAVGGGGGNKGMITVSAGTTLKLSGGTFTSTAGSSVGGPGSLLVSGATANLAGLVNVTGTNIFDSAANLTGDYFATNNTVVISGGSANFSGTGIVAPVEIDLTNGGALGGSQDVTVNRTLHWSGGSMSGSGRTIIPQNATLEVDNTTAPVTLGGRILENRGTALWTGSQGWNFYNGGVITNLPGALFEVQSAVPFTFVYPYGAGCRIDNAGIFRKSASAGAVTIGGSISFNNYGTVDLQSGTLAVAGGGRNTAMITVPAGTTLKLSGGAFTSMPGSSLSGAGSLTVNGATANLAGLVNVTGTNIFDSAANLTGDYFATNNTVVISGGSANFSGTGIVAPVEIDLTNGGALGGSQDVTVSRTLHWSGGSMSGGGHTVIAQNATLTVDNTTAPVTLGGRILENRGTALSIGSQGWNFYNGGVITNLPGALFEVQSAVPFAFVYPYGAGCRIDNAGIFRKSVSAGAVTIGSSISFNNYGTVDLRRGILTCNGGDRFDTGSLLNCAIAGTSPGADYGQLKIAGTATLHGDLSVNFTGGYIPSLNDSFAVLTAGSLSGAFAQFSYPSNQVAMQMNNITNSVILQVGSLAPVPPPTLFPPTLSGTNITVIWSAVPHTTYQLEYNPELSLSNWSAVPGDVTAVSNTAGKTDALTRSNRFYRVRILH